MIFDPDRLNPAETLLFHVSGFLTLIAQGIHPPNEREQAQEWIDKIGDLLAEAMTR